MKSLPLYIFVFALSVHRCLPFSTKSYHVHANASARRKLVLKRVNVNNRLRRKFIGGWKGKKSVLIGKRKVRLFIGGLLSSFMVHGKAAWASDALSNASMMSSIQVSSYIFPTITRQMELRLASRLVFATVAGSIVGWERSSTNHSAGVRTMALVSLGAAAFTMCSAYGFHGKVDPSRMAANVASGVGFLGAGVITTEASKSEGNIVHGLTTAAAIWLSAAIGVANGLGLHFISLSMALATVSILRLGKPNTDGDINQDEQREAYYSRQKMTENNYSSDSHDTSDWDESESKKSVIKKQRVLEDNVHEINIFSNERQREETLMYSSNQGKRESLPPVRHNERDDRPMRENTGNTDRADSNDTNYWDERESKEKVMKTQRATGENPLNAINFLSDKSPRVAELMCSSNQGKQESSKPGVNATFVDMDYSP
mmetsp:Transcript_21252/g.31504  ORF Transcript_21252/g.31504 Transcript_21252/m.31504 type:complete len:429 (-) Transcript_21252:1098-2384(-)